MQRIICINKPKDWTSFDVVNKLSKKLRTKVGHTGTLDPKATGVLVCLVGATKLLPYMDMSTKEYIGTCQLGLKTSTGDIWGKEIDKDDSNYQPTLEEVITVLNSFNQKTYQQKVPMTSAKKVKGKKLMDYQRENIEIETQYAKVTIHSIELLNYELGEITFKAKVSSGTYIRQLCEDIAEKLGTLGTMSALERTACGVFTLEQCINIEDVTEASGVDIIEGLRHYPQVEVDDPTWVYHGKKYDAPLTAQDILLIHKGQPLAIYTYDHQLQQYRSLRGLWT